MYPITKIYTLKFSRIMTHYFLGSHRKWRIFQINCGNLTKPITEVVRRSGKAPSWCLYYRRIMTVQIWCHSLLWVICLFLTGEQSRLCCSVVINSSCSFTLMTNVSRRKRKGVYLGKGWWYRSVQVILPSASPHQALGLSPGKEELCWLVDLLPLSLLHSCIFSSISYTLCN